MTSNRSDFEIRYEYLLSSGLPYEEAFIIANFEDNILKRWPEEWDNTIRFVIKGLYL